MLLGKTSCPGRQRDTLISLYFTTSTQRVVRRRKHEVSLENSRAGSSTLHADQGKIEWQEGDSAPPGRFFQARPGSG